MISSEPSLLFSSRAGRHLYLSRGSQLYDVDGDLPAADTEYAKLFVRSRAPDTVSPPPPQHLSLNVSATCNLGCSYCYAGQGSFGGTQPEGMDFITARQAVDRLLAGLDRTRPATLGFIGGEPFANRKLIHRLVDYSAAAARQASVDLRFSVTTNATLLDDDDRELMRRHPFAVTVSIDGTAAVHDASRPARGGRGSWHKTVSGIAPLLASPGLARIAARATVTRHALDLVSSFDALREVGFGEIGFSPMRHGPQNAGAIEGDDWRLYHAAMLILARRELLRLEAGGEIRLTNLAVALKEIGRGSTSAFPCGAGVGYFSVGANGGWYACHRAIGDEEYRLGDNRGLDEVKRSAFLKARHVDSQTDCDTCWARALCSGGCHQEKAARSSQSCDFVRGWLEFCLTAYCEQGNADAFRGELQ